MPARDRFHDHVKSALLRDGWTITHDPLRLVSGRRNLFVDLGAERLLGAEKGTMRVAIEVKTFGGMSDVDAIEHAVGQHAIYRNLLRKQHPGRSLYTTVPDDLWNTLFQEPLGETAREEGLDHIVRFDPEREEIVRWLPPPSSPT